MGIKGRGILFAIVVGLLISPLLPAVNNYPPPDTVRAQAPSLSKEEALEFLDPYKPALRNVGKYVSSPKLSERSDDTTPITITLPGSSASDEKLVFTLSNVEISGFPILEDEEREEFIDEQGYVTNIFYIFELTQPERNLSLVINQDGVGTVMLGSGTSPEDLTNSVYGNPGDCVELEDENDVATAKYNPTSCLVSVSTSPSQSERESTWDNFAERVIPEELRPSSCPISYLPAITPNSIAFEINFSLIPSAQAIIPAPGILLGTAKLVGNFCTKGLSAANSVVNSLPVKVWGMIPGVGTPVRVATASIKVMSAGANVAINAVKKVAPGVATTLNLQPVSTSGSGSQCTGNFLSGLISLKIGQAILQTIGCFFQEFLESALTEISKFLTTLATFSSLPPLLIDSVAHELIPSAHAANLNTELKSPNSSVVQVWSLSRSLLNIIVILALLVIAFANILHLNINTYAAKKALPGLVIGVIGANASLLIIRFLVDVANAAGFLALYIAPEAGSIPDLITIEFPEALGQNAWTFILASLLTLGPLLLIAAIIFIIYYLFLIIVFAWALFKRLAILYLLIMLSPLAFVAYGIPTMQKYFFQWWDTFLRQLFLLPVILIGMALVVRLADALQIDSFVSLNDLSSVGVINMLIVFAAATAILKLPKTFTKGVIDVTDAAKKAFGMAKVAPQAGMMAAASASRNWTGQGGFKGKIASGVNKTFGAHNGKEFGKRWANIVNSGTAVIGNPEVFQDALKSRFELDDKKRKKSAQNVKFENLQTSGGRNLSPAAWAAQKLGYGTPKSTVKEAFQGREASFGERYPEASTEASRNNDPEDILKNTDDKYIQELLGRVNSGALSLDEYLRKTGRSASPGDRFETSNPIGEAAEISARETAGAVANIEAIYNQIYRKNNQQMNSGRNKATASAVRQASITELQDMLSGAGGGNPFGGGADPNNPDGGSPAPGGGAPLAPSGDAASPPSTGDVQQVQVVNPVTVQNLEQAWQTNKAGELAAHAEALRQELGEDFQSVIAQDLSAIENGDAAAIERLRESLTLALDTSKDTSDPLRTEIQSADPQRLQELAKGFSLVTSGERSNEAIQQRLLAAIQADKAVDQENQQLSGKVELSEETIRSLASNNEALMSHLQQSLGESMNKIMQTYGRNFDPKMQQQVIQALAGTIQNSIAGRHPKSLANILKSMGTEITKHAGLQKLDLQSSLSQVQAQVTNVTNNINETNVNTAGPITPNYSVSPPTEPGNETPPPATEPPQE